MSKKSISFAKGRLEGVLESGWTCGDCGNIYDATVTHCPNLLLDTAHVKLRSAQALHRTRTAATADSDTTID